MRDLVVALNFENVFDVLFSTICLNIFFGVGQMLEKNGCDRSLSGGDGGGPGVAGGNFSGGAWRCGEE